MKTFNGPHRALTTFRNCFEAHMTFDDALGCAGLSDSKPETIEVLRRWWKSLETQFSAECACEAALGLRTLMPASRNVT